MDYKELYKIWSTDTYFDEATREELKAISSEPRLALRKGLCTQR